MDFLEGPHGESRCWASSPALVWEIASHPFAQKEVIEYKNSEHPSPLWKAMPAA
ncbi:MAG: hypothetical protein R2860_16880 [Desulfobacterales bacterium]